jgi:hypothetical protein
MNYFSHARRYLNDPYFAVGTAVPDWLSVLDRKVRARSTSAAKLLKDEDARVVAICGGIIQHHHDDAWFHQTEIFLTLNAKFAQQLRKLLEGDVSMRPSFVGHIAIELLLDDALVQSNTRELDRYYEIFSQVDAVLVEQTINRISPRPAHRLAELVQRFSMDQFLYDYSADGRLLMRVNHVLKRVGLEALPSTIEDWMRRARLEVQENMQELLAGESTTPAWQKLNWDANSRS